MRNARREKTVPVRVGSAGVRMKGAARFDPRDPYHFAAGLSWPRFLLVLIAAEVAINAIFALLYAAVPGSVANARPGSVADAFFFSIETLATVGYGQMYPATLYGHVVSAVEILCGVGFTALVTGLLFARFSRPKALVLYADAAVVALHRGRPTLMVRIANGRLNLLLDAEAHLNLILVGHVEGGRLVPRVHELRLARSTLPAFALTWILMHEIDPRSPLHGYDAARLAAEKARLFVTVSARDVTLAAPVSGTKDYGPASIRFGVRYIDAVSIDEEGRPTADLGRLSAVEPDIGPEPPRSGWVDDERPASAGERP